MGNIAILDQINSTNFVDLKQIYKPTVGHSGFITSLGLTINLKSIPSADFPYIPDSTPPDVLETIFQNIEAETQFKELRILLKKGAGAWIEKAKIRIFNKEPYYEVDLMPYYTKTNTIDVADDLSLGIQVKVGDSLTVADSIVIFGTVVEEKKNNGNEELAARIEALETLLGIFGAPSASLSGSTGLVPSPPAGSADFLLRGDRGWENPSKFATTTTTDLISQNVATKAPIANPDLTGSPKAPTAPAGTNTTQIANTAFVVAAINALIGNATPETLNTLQELATAFGNDPNYAATISTALGTKVTKSGNETIGGNKTFTEAVRIQGLFPGIWLDETDHTIKGAYLVVDGGVLQIQRRSANFGGFEAGWVLVDLITGCVTLSSSAQAISITTGCLSLRGGFSVAGNIVTALPTSPAGLPSGALWRNGTVINVV